MFLFQFVNFYASIFYIAFIKPWFANPPGVESYKIGKYKTEEVITIRDAWLFICTFLPIVWSEWMFGGIIDPIVSHPSWQTSDQQSVWSGNGVRKKDSSGFSGYAFLLLQEVLDLFPASPRSPQCLQTDEIPPWSHSTLVQQTASRRRFHVSVFNQWSD